MGKKVYNEFRNLCGKVPLFMTVSSIMTTEIARIQIRGLLLQATVALASGSFQTIAIENRDHGPMVGNDSVISQHVTKVRYTSSSCAEVL